MSIENIKKAVLLLTPESHVVFGMINDEPVLLLPNAVSDLRALAESHSKLLEACNAFVLASDAENVESMGRAMKAAILEARR